MVAWAGRAPVEPPPGSTRRSSSHGGPGLRMRRMSTMRFSPEQRKWQDGVQAIMLEDEHEAPSAKPPPPLEFRKKLFMATLVAFLAALNSGLTWMVPLLRQGQAEMLKDLSDAEEVDTAVGWTPAQTLLLALAVKFLMTTLVLGLPLPMGSIAPTLVLGSLVGRLFGLAISQVSGMRDLKDHFGEVRDYKNQVMDLEYQMLGRFALLGATSMTAGAMRSFAQVVLVYALTGLPDMLLPLCISSLAAIFVANSLELGFFDSVILVKKLPHLKALATGKFKQTVMDVMQVDFPKLPENATAEEVQGIRDIHPEWPNEIPVVSRLEGDVSMVAETPVLLHAVKYFPVFGGAQGDELMEPQVLVPLQVPPHTELKALLPIFQLLNKTIAFVCEDGRLVGAVTLQNLKARLAARV